eukprot:190308-Chlamydomonas_euryale.AAC.1
MCTLESTRVPSPCGGTCRRCLSVVRDTHAVHVPATRAVAARRSTKGGLCGRAAGSIHTRRRAPHAQLRGAWMALAEAALCRRSAVVRRWTKTLTWR